ncbi:DUF1846 domain-containing protein [Candidatus Fermentibacterales bacterium]|nr:DUF1846 domain-containing protein [Candidatus Fermentibacterales bacterium]
MPDYRGGPLKSGTGFDNDKYLKEQTAEIASRVDRFGNKLYLEFGGKLMYDFHAARVLPGYDPNVKVRLLQELADRAEIVLCIYAGDIERRKIRGDFGITYDSDAMKLIDDLRARGLDVRGVVITRFSEQPSARAFRKRLEMRGVPVFFHYHTRGYPTDIDLVVSEEGYGRNDYIETKKPLVVVTGPGPGSGKLATCLSQLYHEHKRGLDAGYAKFETFPIWNLPLKHPVNAAYEAATADLGDSNLLDPFHLESYGDTAVNYNRDVEAFPLVRRILERITGESSPYASPTEMGVNRAGFGITDDEVVREAARQELVRRYFRYRCEYVMGLSDERTLQKSQLIMEDFDLTPEYRSVVIPAREAAESTPSHPAPDGSRGGAALELMDGTIVTGRRSELMSASAAVVINSIKSLSGIPDRIHLLTPETIGSIRQLESTLGGTGACLNLEEVLIALGISATTSPATREALTRLPELRGTELHITHIPGPGDEEGLRKLGVNLTTDASFISENLFAG